MTKLKGKKKIKKKKRKSSKHRKLEKEKINMKLRSGELNSGLS